MWQLRPRWDSGLPYAPPREQVARPDLSAVMNRSYHGWFFPERGSSSHNGLAGLFRGCADPPWLRWSSTPGALTNDHHALRLPKLGCRRGVEEGPQKLPAARVGGSRSSLSSRLAARSCCFTGVSMAAISAASVSVTKL